VQKGSAGSDDFPLEPGALSYDERVMWGSLGRKAHKAISQGYFWPYMKADGRRYVRKCDKCQRHSKMIDSPAEELYTIASPWPFAMWGMDIVGPLPKAREGREY
jgi:hypothetical protein